MFWIIKNFLVQANHYYRFEMDNSEAGLDSVEAQTSTGVSHDQWKQSYFPMNLIKRGLQSLGLFRTGEPESVPEYLINLKVSDVFHVPGESVEIEPKVFSELSAGKKESLEKLRNNHGDMACFKSKGDSILHIAAANNHPELVKSIVSECPCLLLELDSRNQLPLHVAAHAGYRNVVDALVETMKYVSARLSDEAEKERLNLCIKKNENGDTPLHLALKGRHTNSTDSLVRANQQASFLANNDGISPLYLAVENGNMVTVEMMLEDVDEANLVSRLEGRKYLVHAALRAGSSDTLEFLLNQYPSLIDERDEDERSCVWLAASMGYYKGVKKLLDKSDDGVYQCDKNGSFPIHIAVEKRHMKVVFLLLRRCPDSKHMLNKQGQNIVHVATKSGLGALVLFTYLWVTCSINRLVETQDVDGNSPLHEATKNWRPRTLFVLLLISKVKWLYVRNNKGETALDMAENNRQRNYIFLERVTLMVLLYFYAPITKDSWLKKITIPSEPLEGDKTKDYVNTLLVVAALVATVTFAAGFTIPGGFSGSTDKSSSFPKLGYPSLQDQPLLAFFMVFNIMAMQSSIVTIAIVIQGQLGDQALVPKVITTALRLLLFSLLCMVVAFYWGVMVTFKEVKAVVIFLNVTYAIFLVLVLFNLAPHIILQIPGIPAFFGSYLLVFVMLVDEDSFVISPKEEDPFVNITLEIESKKLP